MKLNIYNTILELTPVLTEIYYRNGMTLTAKRNNWFYFSEERRIQHCSWSMEGARNCLKLEVLIRITG